MNASQQNEHVLLMDKTSGNTKKCMLYLILYSKSMKIFQRINLNIPFNIDKKMLCNTASRPTAVSDSYHHTE